MAIDPLTEGDPIDYRLGDYTQEDLNADLHKLSELDPSFIHSVAQDDIDPLLQVHVYTVWCSIVLSACIGRYHVYYFHTYFYT